jgi:hypothetical protein
MGHCVRNRGDHACTGCVGDMGGRQWVVVGPYMAVIGAIGHAGDG